MFCWASMPNLQTFNKFVQGGFYEQDWCNYKDKYKINNIDLE